MDWLNLLIGPIGGAIFSAGGSWVFVKMSIKSLRKEVEELKARKPELLEFRVGQHEEQLKALRTDLDEFKTGMGEVKSDIAEVKAVLKLIYDRVNQAP